MEQQITRRLSRVYYAMFALLIVTATVLWYLLTKQGLTMFDPQSVVGQVLQYIVIVYVIVSIPTALFLFKRLCRKLSKAEDDMKYAAYAKWGIVRIVVIGLGMTLGIAAFYLLQGYQSMLWCAAISAIGLFFCKPNERKMELDLLPEDMEV